MVDSRIDATHARETLHFAEDQGVTGYILFYGYG